MQLKMRMLTSGILLLWSVHVFADGDGYLSDSLEKNTIINFSVFVKEPVCQIDVPSSVDFGENDALSIEAMAKRDFIIKLMNCNQQIPKPKIFFSGENISSSGLYIKNKEGNDYAKGIGIQILHKSEVVNLSEGVVLDGINEDVSNDFHFLAKLIVLGVVEPGVIESNVVLNLTYY